MNIDKALHLWNLKITLFFVKGIMMGAWPCGKIAMLGKLYGSESISQVYGQIQTLLQENAEYLGSLSKQFIYTCMYNVQ